MNQTRKNTKKRSQGQRPGKAMRKEKILELSLIRSYPKQAIWEQWINALPAKSTTTVTTGVIATTFQVTTTNIVNFATRFASTFVEYRIVRARFKLRMFSSTNPGVIQFWFDDKSTSAPTSVEAAERATLSLSACDISEHTMKWTSADPLDLQYTAVGSAVTPVTFKGYTSNATYGSSITATDYFEIVPEFQIQFRGLQGV